MVCRLKILKLAIVKISWDRIFFFFESNYFPANKQSPSVLTPTKGSDTDCLPYNREVEVLQHIIVIPCNFFLLSLYRFYARTRCHHALIQKTLSVRVWSTLNTLDSNKPKFQYLRKIVLQKLYEICIFEQMLRFRYLFQLIACVSSRPCYI